MTKTLHIELTRKQVLAIAAALNGEASRYDAMVSEKPDAPQQTTGIWRRAAEERRTLVREMIEGIGKTTPSAPIKSATFDFE